MSASDGDAASADRVRASRAGVIFVGGYGRSGSTLLDVIMSSGDRVFGGGELTKLFWAWRKGNRCACGRVLRRCPFWRGVLSSADLTEDRLARAEAVTRAVEGGDERRDSETRSSYTRLWRRIFDSIARESGCEWIVDSSKTAGRARYRARTLAEEFEVPFHFVHLVRQPTAVVRSIASGWNRDMLRGRTSSRLLYPVRVVRAVGGWVWANREADRVRRMVEERCYVCSYEELCEQGASSLREIADATGLDVDVPEAGTDISGHAVEGNRMRREEFGGLRSPSIPAHPAPWERWLDGAMRSAVNVTVR